MWYILADLGSFILHFYSPSFFFFLSHLFIQLIHSIVRCSSKMVTKTSLSGAGWKTWLSISTQPTMPCFSNHYISKNGLDISLERKRGEREGLLRGMEKKHEFLFRVFFGIWIASCQIPTLLDIQPPAMTPCSLNTSVCTSNLLTLQ